MNLDQFNKTHVGQIFGIIYDQNMLLWQMEMNLCTMECV